MDYIKIRFVSIMILPFKQNGRLMRTNVCSYFIIFVIDSLSLLLLQKIISIISKYFVFIDV